nr:MAG TPA: hypothetical protein [Caudoviricetes sp.]
MSYVLFKAGDYGKKGNWTGENFKKLVSNVQSLDIIPFHTSEFMNKGLLRNEIPVIGKFKNIEIKDDAIIANNVEIFNKEHFKNRKVDRLSVEIENGLITRVGALPEGVEPAVSNSGSLKGLEFQKDIVEMDWIENKIINFDRGEEMNLDEILGKINDLSLDDKIKLVNGTLKSLQEHEIEVAKKGIDLSIFEEKKEPKTEDEIKEEAKKEFQKELEVQEFMKANAAKITPAMKSLGIESLIDKVIKENDGIIEFSENGAKKQSNSKEILEKMFENMRAYEKGGTLEFGNDEGNKTYAQIEVEKYQKRHNKGGK